MQQETPITERMASQQYGLSALRTTERISALLDMHPDVLRLWVRKRVVTPTHMGTKGKYRSHLFGYKTAFGLARVMANKKAYGGVPPKLARIIIESEENTPESDHEAQICSAKRLRNDPRLEETFAATHRNNTGRQLDPAEELYTSEVLRLWRAIASEWRIFGYGGDGETERTQQRRRQR